MNQLAELIQELCPDGVRFTSLINVCEISKGTQFNRTDMADTGSYPVINGGIRPSGYIEQYNQNENTITISQGGASAGYVNWISTKFWAGAHCYVLTPKENIDNRYLYHFVKSTEKKLQECQYGAGIPALAKTAVGTLRIPLPPLPVQHEVVRILDKFTELTTELTAELTARKRQYKYYLSNLFPSMHNNDIEWVNLGDVATVTKLAGFEFTKYVTYSETGKIIALRGLNVKDGHLVLDNVKYIDSSNLSMLNRSKLHMNDMLFTYVGTVGQVALVNQEDKYYLAPNVALVRVKNAAFLPKYMMYYFLTNKFKAEQIDKLLQASSMQNIPMEKIRKFKLPKVSINQQRQAIEVLDRFDALCSDLTSGLPAEIAARQRQYEYYRDKFLSFPQKA